jgi:Tripartite tricarboxylate transporter TctB family
MNHSKKRFNPQEAIVPGISILFGIAYFVQTTDASWVAIKWPYALAALAALLWLGVVAVYVFSKGKDGGETHGLSGLKLKPMIILVAPILYIVIMPYLGFALSSLLFLSLLFRSLGGRSWLRNIAVAFIITAFLYVAMILLMQMSLPRLEIGSLLL